MTELQNAIVEVLNKVVFPLCNCELGTCKGDYAGKSCKVWIANQIIDIIRRSDALLMIQTLTEEIVRSSISNGAYVGVLSDPVTLDGEFTLEDLELIVSYLKQKKYS